MKTAKNNHQNISQNGDTYIIHGGKQLNGRVRVQTSKNATLPMLTASLMCPGQVIINDYPHITDLDNMLEILKGLKVNITKTQNRLILDTSKADNSHIDMCLMKTMRSSIFLLGSMLARFKTATIIQPGGCKIGARPIDIHLNGLRQMGVKISEIGGQICFDASNAHSARIKLKIPSVGATENLVQFACLTKGKTVLTNVAKEPEIVDLCNFLISMGAKIKGAGTSKISILGVSELKNTQYTPIEDRIVAGTLLIATAICGGKICLTNANHNHIANLIEKLKQIGCQIEIENDIIKLTSDGKLLSPGAISTGFYPDFATDLQSQMMVLSCVANGETEIFEHLFENRFLIVPELQKMGAIISVINNKHASVVGGKLHKADVTANDLRGGASLVLAGLCAKGVTTVKNVHFIDRGYENFEQILTSLGAKIKRL